MKSYKQMGIAHPLQKVQDWLTQQWVIVSGKKISPNEYGWLISPFGKANLNNENYIRYLAEKENLIVIRKTGNQGLIPSADLLNLKEKEFNLSAKVVDFYENTSQYNLYLSVNWNPAFKIFGILIYRLFSKRLNQLNIPSKTARNLEAIDSEIITLVEPKSNQIKYTFWLRTNLGNNEVVYSGIYGISKLPSGKSYIKAVFPLPNGNATVLMTPSTGANGELILDSSGRNFGDAGFYFLLNDAKGNFWSKYISTFHDRLTIGEEGDGLVAEQILKLWNRRVITFNYKIIKK